VILAGIKPIEEAYRGRNANDWTAPRKYHRGNQLFP
jgi:hypothetical protein